MFRDLVNRFATPFTTGLFAVSLISGVALFFHLGTGVFHSMHEWLSMVLIVPFVFHVWKNWLPLKLYFERGRLIGPLIVSLGAAAVFAVPALTSGSAGGNPQMAMFQAIGSARIADLEPVLKLSAGEIDARLAAVGLTGVDHATSLAAAAKAGGKDTRHVVFSVIQPH